ncbi:MAG: SDR family oxidoreductase [Christensenellaceae bacterium]|jgi:NAD(P)-dependent dehydrogenase (short-subunit alcohol dehydrogenase family)|nr:SDR family oxidoreductase [Christensenellaceae bacterium]
MPKVAVVTGGSSGIGLCTAQALCAAGCIVYELSRHAGSGAKGVCHISADVTKPDEVQAAIERILREQGRVDIVINNAGFGISGAVEFTAAEEAKRLFEVDFFGMVHVNKAILPLMRQAGAGRIVNISSMAGPAAIPFQTYYSAAKAAINAYTLALANEVRPFGITVCAIMPGDIRTGFTAAREKSAAGDDIYNGRIARSVAGMEKDEANGMRPEAAGKYIAGIACKRRVKPLYAIGFWYKCLAVLIKLLPVRVVNALVYLLYAR